MQRWRHPLGGFVSRANGGGRHQGCGRCGGRHRYIGNVSDAKVVQSIPLLDDEALRAVRNGHFAPTMVNGPPVPVRMNVNVNFTLPTASAPPPQSPSKK